MIPSRMKGFSPYNQVMKRGMTIIMLLVLLSPARADWPGLVPPGEVPVYVPGDYDGQEPTPLLIFLHGYSPLTTAWYNILLPLQEDANAKGYIFVKPDGNQDAIGEFYWNATDACCDMFDNNPDHVGYLMAMLESIQANYNIDPRRIHLIGHSNGGFMCHRMACEHSDIFASVVSISGAMSQNPKSPLFGTPACSASTLPRTWNCRASTTSIHRSAAPPSPSPAPVSPVEAAGRPLVPAPSSTALAPHAGAQPPDSPAACPPLP